MDNIELIINNKYKIKTFDSYNIDRNLLEPESNFSFSLKRPDFDIKNGDQCQLKINGILQYMGIIDIINTSYSNSSINYSFSGRNFIGLIVDNYCQKFNNYQGEKFKTIVFDVVSSIPIIKNIITENKLIISKKVESLVTSSDADEWKPAVGETVFEFLKKICNYHGVVFYMDSSNNLIFDKPSQLDKTEFYFNVKKKSDNSFISLSNIFNGSLERNCSKQYKNFILYGQNDEDSNFNIKKSFTDDTSPIEKTIVYSVNKNENLKTFGNGLIEQQKINVEKIKYTVAGHSQNSNIFDINKFCRINDECLGINGTYLIYGVNFKLSKNNISTDLEIGKAGMYL